MSLDECQRRCRERLPRPRTWCIIDRGEIRRLRNLRVCDLVNGKLHIARSKTGRSRNIILTQEATQFFQQLAAGRAGSEFLFLRFGLPWKPSDQQRPMAEACKHARIEPAVGIHQLRHTYCSLAVMAGMPLQVLAQNLGHSSVRMIEQHYSHLRDSFVDKAIRDHAPRFGMVEPSNVKSFAER